ncbi:MAG: hypothetical protein H3C34_09285 [Caldilineaceae bacterium]|nr:hypothetical protein [Caldilineaceae bacterium]
MNWKTRPTRSFLFLITLVAVAALFLSPSVAAAQSDEPATPAPQGQPGVGPFNRPGDGQLLGRRLPGPEAGAMPGNGPEQAMNDKESFAAGRWAAARVPLGFPATVESVDGDLLTVVIAQPAFNHRFGGAGSFVKTTVTLTVPDTAILFGGDLEPIGLDALEVDDAVYIVPQLYWGNLQVRILVAGDAERLSASVFAGRLVKEEGNTLTLTNVRQAEFTVTVADNTIWYDGGDAGRPESLREGLPLRILGAQSDDGSVHAVLILPAGFR